MTDPSSRMLRLLSLLQTHRFWPGTELSDRLDVSPRTVRRDVDRLRELGYPVDATRGASGGYRLAAGSALPPLLLDDEEAVAIAVGLRTATTSAIDGIEETSVRALAKLEQVLPARLRRRVSSLQVDTLTWGRPRPTIDPEVLIAVAAACRDDERLQFDYRRRGEDHDEGRSVEPHRLACLGQRWYLVAWDTRREDWRSFRVDRISTPRASGARFTRRELPAEDAAAFVQQSLRTAFTRFVADVTVHAPAEHVAPQVRPFRGEVTEIDAGSCRLRIPGDHLGWLGVSLAMLDSPYEVHGPPEYLAHVREVAARMSAASATA